MSRRVRVYVVTYRRPLLLKRALQSLVQQTYSNWTAEVLNDDPQDFRVPNTIAEIADPRIQLSTPASHRGGTGNFNLAFRAVAEPFASVLEDDNWWEPDFLRTMLDALERHPTVSLACANEQIWSELPDGHWHSTGRRIWADTAGESLFPYEPAAQCGSAKLCNSALLFRTAPADAWQTPASIPIDVTEHFRERVVPHPILLVHPPLVNYAETLATHRSQIRGAWGSYQVLLIGSVFAASPAGTRCTLAQTLWRRARSGARQHATNLLAAGWCMPEARELWRAATPREKFRYCAGTIRHPAATLRVRTARRRHASEWQWLVEHGYRDPAIN